MNDTRSSRRDPVSYLYTGLNWDFIKLVAEIAAYAKEKYGTVEDYTFSELTGDKSPMNHIAEHLRQYWAAEPHDHFGGQEYHLAAIAYNSMMEFWYCKQRGCIPNPLSRGCK